MEKNPEHQQLFILNMIQQYGHSGHKYHTSIGVYSNQSSLDSQMDYIRQNTPNTSDYRYHFEVVECQPNAIGNTKDFNIVSEV